MKKVYGAILSFCLLVAGATGAQAAETAALGNVNVAVKVYSLHFVDSYMRDAGADTTTTVALEGYGSVAPNLYLGGEVGHAHVKGSHFNIDLGPINTEATFVPVEVNLKRTVKITPNIFVDFGGGFSYNYYRYQAKATAPFLLFTQEISGWMVGGQAFVDVNVTLGSVFIGVNGKGQVVAPADRINNSGTVSYDEYSNWRAGGQIGVRF